MTPTPEAVNEKPTDYLIGYADGRADVLNRLRAYADRFELEEVRLALKQLTK